MWSQEARGSSPGVPPYTFPPPDTLPSTGHHFEHTDEHTEISDGEMGMQACYELSKQTNHRTRERDSEVHHKRSRECTHDNDNKQCDVDYTYNFERYTHRAQTPLLSVDILHQSPRAALTPRSGRSQPLLPRHPIARLPVQPPRHCEGILTGILMMARHSYRRTDIPIP